MNNIPILLVLINKSDIFTRLIVYGLVIFSLILISLYWYAYIKINYKNTSLFLYIMKLINEKKVYEEKNNTLIDLFKKIIETHTNLKRNEILVLLHHASLMYIRDEKKVSSLCSIAASSAPLIGLLGTVWGIIDAFMAMASTGSGDLSSVAPGIAEALITTFAGLLVAIPGLIFYHILNGIISKYMQNCESVALLLTEKCE